MRDALAAAQVVVRSAGQARHGDGRDGDWDRDGGLGRDGDGTDTYHLVCFQRLSSYFIHRIATGQRNQFEIVPVGRCWLLSDGVFSFNFPLQAKERNAFNHLGLKHRGIGVV